MSINMFILEWLFEARLAPWGSWISERFSKMEPTAVSLYCPLLCKPGLYCCGRYKRARLVEERFILLWGFSAWYSTWYSVETEYRGSMQWWCWNRATYSLWPQSRGRGKKGEGQALRSTPQWPTPSGSPVETSDKPIQCLIHWLGTINSRTRSISWIQTWNTKEGKKHLLSMSWESLLTA